MSLNIKKEVSSFMDFFNFYLKLLQCVGIRINFQCGQLNGNIWKRFNTLYMILCVSTMSIASVLSVLFISIGDKSVEKKLSSLIILLTNIELLSKVLCIVKNSDRIAKILKELETYNEIRGKSTKYLMKESNIILVYSKVAVVSMIVFYFIPLITTFVLLIKDHKWIAIYTNEVWYPFDDQNVYYYGPIYLFQTCFTFTFMCYYTAIDGLILMIMIHINHQFLALSLKFCNIENSRGLNGIVDRHCQVTR